MVGELPTGWTELALVLRPNDVPRAATLLGSLSPGVAGDELHLRVASAGDAGPGAIRRLLGRLDAQGIAGTLELVRTEEAPAATGPTMYRSRRPGTSSRQACPRTGATPCCLVELRSSDELDPAALALAPVNPSRHGKTLGFRFRVARRFGYGAAPGMARRCLERVDEAGIPGRLRLLEAFSDTKPVLTQGPTFVISDRAV